MLPTAAVTATTTRIKSNGRRQLGPDRSFWRSPTACKAEKIPYLGTLQVERQRNQLMLDGLSAVDRIRLRMQLSWELLRLGKADDSLEQIETAFNAAGSVPALQIPAEMHLARGLAYLRHAEVANCIKRRNPDCCVFPLQHGGVHTVTASTTQARSSFLAFLKSHPDDLAVRWLLNISAMALGDHPQGVPKRYLIPADAFRSEYDIGRFIDRAGALGIDTDSLCGGAIVEDFNADGFLDIVTSTYDPLGPLAFYRNLGNGRFEDVSRLSGLDDQLGGLNCLAADFDNDRDMDILVLRGAWLSDDGSEDGRIRNSLLRNDGAGRFTDVTRQAGLADPAYPTQAAVWADFDNDGDLDLFVGNESRTEQSLDSPNYPSQLFQNRGDGTFQDIASRAGVTNDRYCKGVTAGDYDNDGDLDLYVSNIGRNRLYRNQGDGTFVDRAEELGVTHPAGRSFATWFFDYNNDGRLDLFVAAYEATLADIAADYLGLGYDASPPCLYRNDGDGKFSNVTPVAGLQHPYLPMGANFGDLDNDGYLDIYLATGDPGYRTLVPNVMLRSDRGSRFQNVTTSGGFGHLQKGHGVAFADLDNDGDQDIYHQLGGFYPGDRFRNALFLNPGHGNHFLTMYLVGRQTNRFGLGARIKVVADLPEGEAEFHRAVGSCSSFGGSPIRQEIGLANAKSIVRIEIRWPVSKTTQVITDVPLNSTIQVTEAKSGFERIKTKTVSFNKDSRP